MSGPLPLRVCLTELGLSAPVAGYNPVMTNETPEGEPTTEVSVETPAKNATTVEVDGEAAPADSQPDAVTETLADGGPGDSGSADQE